MHTSSRKAWLTMAVAAMSAVAVGCAITDYAGWANHKTAAESALWGSDIAFITGIPGYDGTYNYTVQYNCRGATATGSLCGDFSTGTAQPMTIITSYRNPVISAFTWYGIIDREGDNIQGKSGSSTPPPFTMAGKFQADWVAADNLTGCQFYGFFDPYVLKQNFSGLQPGIGLCFTFPQEEVDANQDLQQSFSSLSDLVSQIWSGALGQSFTLQVTQLTLNGTPVTLTNALSISATQNGVRPTSAAVDFTTPGGQEVLRALLNTPAGQPVSISATFAGGMSLNMPVHMSVAVNHDVLAQMVH